MQRKTAQRQFLADVELPTLDGTPVCYQMSRTHQSLDELVLYHFALSMTNKQSGTTVMK